MEEAAFSLGLTIDMWVEVYVETFWVRGSHSK